MDSSIYFTALEYSYHKLFKREAWLISFFTRLGPCPPLPRLLAIPNRYRRVNVKGRIFLAGERIISFRPSDRGNHLWPVLVTLYATRDVYTRMIGYDYGVYIQPSPVLGLGYIDFFIPSQRDLLIRVIGYNPTVSRLLQVATWMRRTGILGRLVYHRPDTVGLESISNDNCHRGGRIWPQIVEAARSRPNAIIYDL